MTTLSNNRKLANRATQTVSVEDFGAVGDGVTNDTTAFTNAIGTGRNIKLTDGKTYLVTDLDITTAGQGIFGNATLKLVGSSGTGNEVLKLSGADCWAEGFTVDGNEGTGTPAIGRGLVLTGSGCVAMNIKAQNTDVASLGGHGISVFGSDCKVIMCKATNCGYAGFKTFDGSHRAVFRDCRTTGHHIKGFVHNGDSDSLVIDGFYAQSDVVGVEENILLDAGSGKLLSRAILRNVICADNPNNDATGNGAKFELTTDLVIEDSRFEQVSTVVSSVRIQNGPTNMSMKNVFVAKDINGLADGTLQRLILDNVTVGEKGVSGSTTSLDGIDAPYVHIKNCTFNDYTSVAIDLEGVDQHVTIEDTVFDRDTTGNCIWFSGSGSLTTAGSLTVVGEQIKSGGTLTGSSSQTAMIARDLSRKVFDKSSIPSTGTWTTGDFVYNTAPVPLGGGGSVYIINGWRRLTTGSAHVLDTDWVQTRTLTGL